VISLVIPGKPVPLDRELVQSEWMAAGRPSLGSAPFTLSARFYGARADSDIGNLVKAVLDALNSLAFADGSQCVCLSGCHKLPIDTDGARAVIELWSA
jgi:hypothetical protein